MKKYASLQEIDILKLLLFILIFLLVCVLMSVFFVIPSIKEYKKLKTINQGTLINLNKIEQIYKLQAGELDIFKIQNRRTLQAIANEFNEEKFQQKAKEFFDEIQIEKLNNEEDDKLINYKVKLNAQINTPNNFYNFIDFINSYENIILIDFPVQMQKEEKQIKVDFNIKVLKVNSAE